MGCNGFCSFFFLSVFFKSSRNLTRFTAKPDKVPEHTFTCNRVKVGITAQGIVYDRTIKIVLNPNPAGELVGIARALSQLNFGVMKFMTPEKSSTKG